MRLKHWTRLTAACVLRLGLLQDGDVGVGVFPEGEEILVCTLRFCRITRHRVSTTDLQMGQCADGFVHDEPG